MTRDYPGIDVDQWQRLRALCDEFRWWSDIVMPGTRFGIELRPRNENLTHWTLTRIAFQQWNNTTRYDVTIHTPPANPAWLTRITKDNT